MRLSKRIYLWCRCCLLKYVQAWIQSIRDKPETLIRAIKDAQAAATYMDYKAGLITDKEYEQACGSVLEVKQKERDRER